MRMKSVLLGSAAALGFGGVAQAADLGVPFEAEPVDYVRVCDAFGTGYYYIPGTDTCLKLSGYVRFEARFFSSDVVTNVDFTTDGSIIEHEDSYEFFTRGSLTVEARSQTDWGPLVGVMTLEGDFTSPGGEGDAFYVDDTLLSLGPLYAGYTQSLFDQIGGGYGFIGLDGGVAITDNKLNTVGLNWAFNGFGLAIALEDNRYRAEDFFEVSAEGDFPDLVAALFGEWGNLGAAVSFMYMDTDNTFGVQGYVEAVNLGILDVLAGASYLNGDSGDVFSVLAGLRANWMANLSSSINVRWDECGGYASCDDGWFLDFDTRYEPVNNFLVAGGVLYDGEEEDWTARLRLQRNFGN